jgi:hypothetical protein
VVGGEDTVKNDRYVGEEFRDDIESPYTSISINCRPDIQKDSPQTVHNKNSIVPSDSFRRFKLIAIAACPMMIVPM